MKHLQVPEWYNPLPGGEITDPEVLIVLTMELMALYDHDEIDDSRFFEGMAREAADLFCRRHASDDEDYWMDRHFLDDVITFAREVREAAPESWLNSDYSLAFGKQSLRDAMAVPESHGCLS